MRTQATARGAEALFAAAFTFAFTAILVRAIAPMWGDNAQVAARFTIVLILLLGYRYFRKNKVKIRGQKKVLAAVLGVSFAITVLFFTVALGKTTIANTLFVFYATNMISSFGLGTIFLKESITTSKLMAIVLALAGLVLYSGAIAGGSLGIIFSIIAGLSSGVFNLVSKKLQGADHNAVLVTQFTVGASIAVLATLISGDEILRTVSLQAALLTVLFALVILTSYSLMLYGFQHFDVNVGAVIMSSELIFAVIMAYFFFGEVPKAHELLGGTIIFAGSIIGSGIFEKTRSGYKQMAQPD